MQGAPLSARRARSVHGAPPPFPKQRFIGSALLFGVLFSLLLISSTGGRASADNRPVSPAPPVVSAAPAEAEVARTSSEAQALADALADFVVEEKKRAVAAARIAPVFQPTVVVGTSRLSTDAPATATGRPLLSRLSAKQALLLNASAAPRVSAAPPVDRDVAGGKTAGDAPPSPLHLIVSLFVPWSGKFVRATDEAGVLADADYPWAEDCWWRVVPLGDGGDALAPTADEQAAAGRAAPGLSGGGAKGVERVEPAGWFGLVSALYGRALRLNDASGRERAWVPTLEAVGSRGERSRGGEVKRRSRRERGRGEGRLRDGGDGGEEKVPPVGTVFPAGASWQLVSGRLRNRLTGGFLNGRKGGHMRGHGNSGPPWRASLTAEPSNLLELRVVPAERVATAYVDEGYAFLSVDYHIATAQACGCRCRAAGVAGAAGAAGAAGQEGR